MLMSLTSKLEFKEKISYLWILIAMPLMVLALGTLKSRQSAMAAAMPPDFYAPSSMSISGMESLAAPLLSVWSPRSRLPLN